MGDDIEAILNAIRARQRGPTDTDAERAIKEALCRAQGTALGALKRALDAAEDHRDLCALLYQDIDDDSIRGEVIAHFASQASALERRMRVLSDIDDTLYANWKDGRYPKKTVYPGVLTFYDELAGKEGCDGHPDLVFLTARPDGFGWFEDFTRSRLAKRVRVRFSVLSGSLASARSSAKMAAKKLENFLRYRDVWPECEFVFVGDSGQGDAILAEQMMERGTVRAALIHDVVATSDEARKDLRRRGVVFFDTYVGAAHEARALGLLDDAAVARIHEACRADLEAIVWEEGQRARIEDLFARDRTIAGL
jgi:hypothetical protein